MRIHDPKINPSPEVEGFSVRFLTKKEAPNNGFHTGGAVWVTAPDGKETIGCIDEIPDYRGRATSVYCLVKFNVYKTKRGFFWFLRRAKKQVITVRRLRVAYKNDTGELIPVGFE